MNNNFIFIISRVSNKLFQKFISYFFVYPKRKHCNICSWEGGFFLNDQWHKGVICPRCESTVRHRLFKAGIDQSNNKELYSCLKNKKILHCAPDKCLKDFFRSQSKSYTTGDLLRQDCDIKIDLCSMSNIKNSTFDVLIIFDVLEHVGSFSKALKEIHRVLTKNGYAILTVPQKDGLEISIEGDATLSPEEKTNRFGQWDHLRLFGSDFKSILKNNKFDVIEISEKNFSSEIVKKFALKPLTKSSHPLATNERKIFFCKKVF